MHHNRQTAGPRLIAFFIAVVVVSLSLSGCGVTESIDNVISRIESAQEKILKESGAWRDELDQLSTDLKQLEGQVADDARNIVTSASNHVRALVTDAVAMTDQAVESRIAQAGTEFRCNGNFIRKSVVEELGFLIDDLKFWKDHHTRGAQPPAHGTCWIDPGAVSMYQSSEGSWVADTVNMEAAQPIINIYGYNFRSDALPTVDLQTVDSGARVPSAIKAIYRTNYVISIDLSAGLTDMPNDLTLVLNWPDDPQDSSTISLRRTSEASLVLRDPVFSVERPVATKDWVILQVRVTNEGDRASDSFDIIWFPEPGVTKPVSHGPIAAHDSDIISFPAYQYQNSGDHPNNVTITGGVSENFWRFVEAPPHIPAEERHCCGSPFKDQRTVYWGQVGGHGFDQRYGEACAPGYVRSRMSLDITENTEWDGKPLGKVDIRWANENPADCTVLVHYSIPTPGIGQRNNVVGVTIFIFEKGV